MASVGTINKSYVSALDPMLDTREISKNVTDLYNEDELTDILLLGNRKEVTTASLYYDFVNESLFKLGDTTGSTVTGTGSATITTTFTVASSGHARKNDLVKFVDNNVGLIQSVSTSAGADTVVIKSVNATNIAHVAGEKLSIISMAVGENSDTPINIRYGLSKFSNKVQIFRETSKITDVQNATTIEVSINGSNRWAVKDHFEKTIKMKGSINAAMWGGDMSATNFSDASPALVDQVSVTGGGGGGPVQTTRGVDKYIESYGTLLTNTTLGTSVQADLENALDAILAARGAKEYLVVGSDKSLRQQSTFYKGLGSGGVTSARLNVDGKEVNFGVEKVTHGSFTLNYAPLGALDHPTLFSQTVIAKSIYYLPYNMKVKTEGGASKAALGIKYFPSQSKYGNELIEEIHYGANSPINPNGTQAFMGVDWKSTQGLQFLGAQFAVRQKVRA
jgi:hypothetical protein